MRGRPGLILPLALHSFHPPPPPTSAPERETETKTKRQRCRMAFTRPVCASNNELGHMGGAAVGDALSALTGLTYLGLG